MGHYKLLFFASVSLSVITTTPHTLAATSAETSSTQALPEQVASTELTQQLQSLLQPLIHYPDYMVKVAFAASANPEQIALAARYLNEPSSVDSKPDFDQQTLALMQYPALLNYMAANLVWVSELGQMLATQEQGLLWSALADERLAPAAAGEPVHVVRTKRYVVHPSRPVHTSAIHRVNLPAPLHHQIWWHANAYHYHPRGYVRRHHPRHNVKHWRLGRFYGHRPRHSFHHRGFNDHPLFHHQRKLERRIHRQQREHRREHRSEHRQEQRNHRQERRHRGEHRQERRQDRRHESRHGLRQER